MSLWLLRAKQLASVAQLVGALHQNRRAAGSIPAKDLKLQCSQLFLVIQILLASHSIQVEWKFIYILLDLTRMTTKS